MEPKIGDSLAHDPDCYRITFIALILRKISDFHFVIVDDQGETHLCVEASKSIQADFYVDHLGEVTSRFGFYSICRAWQDPYI